VVGKAAAMMQALKGNGSAGNGLLLPPAVDDRTYGSDDEDYDEEDKSVTSIYSIILPSIYY
jgi:hypothetical protein